MPSNWQAYPEPAGSMSGLLAEWQSRGRVQFAARARDSVVSAHAAVDAFRTEQSSLDCLAGMELTILDAADSVLGQANFDAFHRPVAWPHLAALAPGEGQRRYVLVGLGVPVIGIDLNVDPYRMIDNRARTSLAKHLLIVRYHVAGGDRGERPLDRAGDALAGPITVADMVPGDYAYLSNLPDYQRRAPSGVLAGENAFYLGRGASGTPVFLRLRLLQRARAGAERPLVRADAQGQDGRALQRHPPADAGAAGGDAMDPARRADPLRQPAPRRHVRSALAAGPGWPRLQAGPCRSRPMRRSRWPSAPSCTSD